jgi:hypothetical protein
MSAAGRFAFGALGGVLPVLASLVALDLVSFAALIDQHTLTEGLCVGYALRVIGLVGLGGAMAWLNNQVDSPLALAQIGIAAPALVTALLSGAPAKKEPDPAKDSHTSGALFISRAYADRAPEIEVRGRVTLAANFLTDFTNGLTPGLGHSSGNATSDAVKQVDRPRGAAITNTATGDCWVVPTKDSLDTVRTNFPLPEYDVESGACPPNTGVTTGKAGFIFIGNEQAGANNVNMSYLAKDSGETIPFDQLVVGQTYTVTKNLYLRGGQPLNDPGYFSAQPNLGLVKAGSKVTLDSTPVPIDRPTLKQAWARVKVLNP